MSNETDKAAAEAGLYSVDTEYANAFDEISGTKGPAYEETFMQEKETDEYGNVVEEEEAPPAKDEPVQELEKEEEPEQPPKEESKEASDGESEDDDPKKEEESKGSSDVEVDATDKRLSELEQAQRIAEHKERSANGRISALTKKLDEARAALDATKDGGEQKSDKQEGFDPPDPDDDKAWAELESQYPQLAAKFDKRIVERLKAMGGQLPKQEKERNTVQEEQLTPEQTTYLSEQRAVLKEAYPNFEEVGSHPFFREYVGSLTQAQQALANSNEAQDVITFIRDFYTPYYNSIYPQDAGNKSGEAGDSTSAVSDKAQRALDRKQKVLEDTEVKGGQRRFSPGKELEDDGKPDQPGGGYMNLFDKIAKQKQKDLSR